MDASTNDPTDGAGTDPDASGSTADAEDLRATEDSIRTDIRRLADVEDEKRALPTDDPKIDALSNRAVELAARIHRETKVEQQLSVEID